MLEIVRQENMTKAYKRVVGNKGSACIDGMQVEYLKKYLNTHGQTSKEHCCQTNYYPQKAKQVEIPKLQGGIRLLEYLR